MLAPFGLPEWIRMQGTKRRRRRAAKEWLLLLLCLSVAMACSGATDGTAEERLQRIYELDKADQVVVAIHDVSRDGEAYLFEDLPAGTQLDPSYEACLELCQAFDPAPRTRDDEKEEVGGRIDAFLTSVGEKPVIRFVLEETGTRLEDLKAGWFGPGRGFEHIFCGEARGDGRVGGYHWWYKFYEEERQGLVDYEHTIEGKGDPGIATIRFTWDPDGSGNTFHPLAKPIGGFTIGDSPAALLALGHLALHLGLDRDREGEPGLVANINGVPYRWVIVVDRASGSLVTLYPLANRP